MFYAASHLCGGETDLQQRPFMEEDRENVSTIMAENRTCFQMCLRTLLIHSQYLWKQFPWFKNTSRKFLLDYKRHTQPSFALTGKLVALHKGLLIPYRWTKATNTEVMKLYFAICCCLQSYSHSIGWKAFSTL